MKKSTPIWLLKLISISLGISIGFFLLEFFARLLPASDEFLLELPIICEDPLNPDYSCIFRRKKFFEGRFTRGKFPPFPIDANKRTNDIGQFSDVDFAEFHEKGDFFLKIISIGDSFVEASQVDNQKTFHGILNKYNSPNDKKIISTAIGTAGNAFPQYIIHTFFVDKQVPLNKSILIIPIIENDFDESLIKYNSGYSGAKFNLAYPSEIYFQSRYNNTRTVLNRFLISNSYLTRYLLLNLKITDYLTEYPICLINSKRYCPVEKKYFENNNNPNHLKKQRINDSKKATDIFLNHISNIRLTNEEKINTIFVMDAERQNIYNKSLPKDKFTEIQRKYFIKKAMDLGFGVLDLEEIFENNYRNNQQKFEFVNDGHWNENAHEIVADEIANYLNLKKSTFKIP